MGEQINYEKRIDSIKERIQHLNDVLDKKVKTEYGLTLILSELEALEEELKKLEES